MENLDRWKKLEDQARALLEVQQILGIKQRQLDHCRSKCKIWVLELEDKVKEYQEIKERLSKLSPLWTSEEFNEIAEKVSNNPEYSPSSEELENVFLASMANFFQGSADLRTDLSEIKIKIDHGIKNGTDPSQIIDNIVMRHGFAVDMLLKRGLKNGHQQLCALAAQKAAWDTSISNRGAILKYGLIAASMYPSGGTSALAVGGVRGVAATPSKLQKLAKILPKSRLAGTISGFLLSGKLLQERIYLADKCDDQLMSLKFGEANQAEWAECIKESKNASPDPLLMIAPAAMATLPLTAKLLKQFLGASQPRLGFSVIQKPGGKNLTVMDLSEQRILHENGLESVSTGYWNYVGKVYGKKLEFTEKEIKGFIKSSKEAENRTKLIVATKGPANEEAFEGGVAMITSSNAKELLSLEKATGMRLPRNGKKIGEVVRLVGENDSKLMVELLKKLSEVSKLDKDLTTLYILTSKAHLRLYTRLRVPYVVIDKPLIRDAVIAKSINRDVVNGKPIDRDVVVMFDAKRFQEVMALH